MPKIKIHYFSPDAPRLKMTEKGDWIDLYCAETMTLHAGDFALVPLGVSMQLPEGYEGDSFAFSDEVMEKTDVFLTPGGIFGSEGNGYIRITLCCPEALLKKATEKIKAAFGK